MSRRVWVLTAIAAVLSVFALWPPRRTPPPRIDFFLPALADVERLQIRRTGAPHVELRRGPSGWSVGGDALDPFAMEALESAFAAPIEMDAVRTVRPGEEVRYGVGEHAITVKFDDDIEIQVGKVVDGRRTFVARLDEPGRAYRARANLRAVFDRPASSWPDRRLFSQRYDDISGIESWLGARVDWRATRETAQAPWDLLVPARALADPEGVANVVNTMVTAQVERFVDDPPVFERTLVATTFGGASIRLELGPRDASGARRARVGQRTGVLPHHLAAFLSFDRGAVQEQRVFPVELDDVVQVQAGEFKLARVEDQWRLGQGGPAVPTDQAEPVVQGILSARSAGHARPPEGAFAAPFHTVVVRTRDNIQHAVVIGAVYNGAARYAQIPGRGPVVLSGETVERLRPNPAALEPK